MSLAAFAACALLMTPGAGAQEPADSLRHPLDPLTAAEYRTVAAALGDEAYLGPAGLYPLVTLQEPPKDEVLAWRPGDPVARRALVVAQTRERGFEGVVDLADGAVVSWRALEGEEPPILLSEEWWFAQRKVLGDEGVRDALARRGITEIAGIVCLPHTVGYYGTPEEEGRRLVKVACYDGSGTENYWARPIEGLIALVDLGAGEVVRVVEAGAVPMPRVPAGYDEASVGRPREPVRPIELVRPEGPSFEVEGHLVRWQKWRFRFRMDPRVGPVVSTVRYEDEGRPRSVLYQGSLSELFVPYMDPSVGWYFRTYMDAGEYGMGKLAVELEPGLDCPGDARLFGAVFADDWGEPYERERVACLFERYAGDAAWRHSDAVTERTEVRRSTELVLRSVSVVGNYDYTFDWVFRQDGSIRVAVGTSGIPQVKAVAASRAGTGTGAEPGGPPGREPVAAPGQEGTAEDGLAHGRLVGEHALAVNHDHFFSFRLDLDVDGRENSFVVDRLRTRTLPPAGPRKSLWVLDSRVVPTERAARLRIDLERPALWRIVNRGVAGPVGYPPSYELKPGTNAVSLLSPEDWPQRRAGFTDYHLWVTRYDPAERHAAGAYPNQSEGGHGLPAWTAADRPIQDTDIVAWYTLGYHHAVRAEDWPVLPTTWSGFELRPFDFFPRNPALDLPGRDP